MKRITTIFTAALAVLAFSTALVYAQIGGNFGLSWSTVDGGGGTFSTSEVYSVGGTIGQPNAGRFCTPFVTPTRAGARA